MSGGLQKACDWLNIKCKYGYMPVVANRRGYAQFIAYVFKLKRPDKVSVWYCVDTLEDVVVRIRRICTY